MKPLLWLQFVLPSLLLTTLALESSPLNLFTPDQVKKLMSTFNVTLSELDTICHLMTLHKRNDINLDGLFKNEKSFTQMANKAGLPMNEYELTTEDGYILRLFHIQGNGTSPVLLMHGFLDSADIFILRGNTSLAKKLVNEGYDVYLGNVRGNKYSRKHVSKDPDTDNDYWDFSFHEMGIYDLPATIDFILEKHAVPSLHIIGHSQGNLIMWVMGSERPEYNDKVKVGIALAPVAFAQNISRSSLKFLATYHSEVESFYKTLNIPQFVHEKGLIRMLLLLICPASKVTSEFCLNVFINPIQGFDNEELEEEFLIQTFLQKIPTSTSLQDALHLAQLNYRKKFARYDYGLFTNLVKYWSFSPPEYDLSKVSMKVALLQGANDYLSSIEDTDMLRSKLPNIIHYIVVDRPQCTHVDFLVGKHAYRYVYTPVLNIIKETL